MNNYKYKKFNSIEEIKKYFRRKIKSLHPDKGGDKEEFLNFISWYYQTLQKFEDTSYKVHIVKNYPAKGNYIFSILEFTVEEIALGGKKKIKIPYKEELCKFCKGTGKSEKSKKKKCNFCKGKGIIELHKSFDKNQEFFKCPYCKGLGYLFTNECEFCGGKGRIRKEKEVFIEIPKGLKEGDILYIPDKLIGSICDLYYEVNILPHPYFLLRNGNLIYKCKIPFWEVILNKEIIIMTLEGKEKLPSKLFTKDPPIVLKERGPFLKNGKRGDLLIDFQIYVPGNIPQEAKRIISKAVEILQKIMEEKNGFNKEGRNFTYK